MTLNAQTTPDRAQAREAFFARYAPEEFGFGPDIEDTVFGLQQLAVTRPELGLQFGTPRPYLTKDSGYALDIPVSNDSSDTPARILVNRVGGFFRGPNNSFHVFAASQPPLRTAWWTSLILFERAQFRPDPKPVRDWPRQFVRAVEQHAVAQANFEG